MGDKRLLKTGEVAQILSVSAESVRRWIKAGKIRASKTPGGQHRITPGEVRRILEGGLSSTPAR